LKTTSGAWVVTPAPFAAWAHFSTESNQTQATPGVFSGDEPIFIEHGSKRRASVSEVKMGGVGTILGEDKALPSDKRGIIGTASSVDFQ
jgi:hypothetical protein